MGELTRLGALVNRGGASPTIRAIAQGSSGADSLGIFPIGESDPSEFD